MRAEVFKDHASRSTGISVRITDREFQSVFSSEQLLVSVRDEVAARLADHVMAKLRPAVDKALTEVFGGPKPE